MSIYKKILKNRICKNLASLKPQFQVASMCFLTFKSDVSVHFLYCGQLLDQCIISVRKIMPGKEKREYYDCRTPI